MNGIGINGKRIREYTTCLFVTDRFKGCFLWRGRGENRWYCCCPLWHLPEDGAGTVVRHQDHVIRSALYCGLCRKTNGYFTAMVYPSPFLPFSLSLSPSLTPSKPISQGLGDFFGIVSIVQLKWFPKIGWEVDGEE